MPGSLVLPHASLQERPFVLRPLLDVAPNWRHPGLKVKAKALSVSEEYGQPTAFNTMRYSAPEVEAGRPSCL